LNRAAYTDRDSNKLGTRDPWKLCTVTQVEEVKSILRLLPIWACTILYSVVFTQMASMFVVQGAAMRRTTQIPGFFIPASSLSAFDILAVAATIFLYRRAICPFLARFTGSRTGPTELQRMGFGLVVGALAMAAAGTVELFRKDRATAPMSSDLHIMWQAPQYALIGLSEVTMYVGQLEFFNSQMPDGLKSFGSALCMMSMSLGNYFSDVIVSAVTKVTTTRGRPGWIPTDLNEGQLEKFYFMLAMLAVADFAVYLSCASRYRSGKVDGRSDDEEEEEEAAGQVASP
jgi:solute carrier family 15 (peptide/histidine transporter), member 3/4